MIPEAISWAVADWIKITDAVAIMCRVVIGPSHLSVTDAAHVVNSQESREPTSETPTIDRGSEAP